MLFVFKPYLNFAPQVVGIIGVIAKKTDASRDLLLDYLYRKNGEIDIDECARDLNMSKSRILQMLNLLKVQRKIKIEQ